MTRSRGVYVADPEPPPGLRSRNKESNKLRQGLGLNRRCQYILKMLSTWYTGESVFQSGRIIHLHCAAEGTLKFSYLHRSGEQ